MANKQDKPSASAMDRDAVISLTRKILKGEARSKPVFAKAAAPVMSQKTDFATLDLYQQMKTQRAVGDLIGLKNPYFNTVEEHAGPTATIDGREHINFASYDYLGLNADQQVAKAAHEAVERYGTSASGSRPTAGNRPIHRQLENQLAELYHAEDALAFVSGHSTNVSTIGDLMGPSDLILYDALSHNSITVGAKLSGAARRIYSHNDVEELDNILTESRDKHERVLIVVEGLYSMDGDLPDLPRLVEIKNRHDAWLMVDDAHALGVVGPTGRGVFEQYDMTPDNVDIWMGTTSKTLSGCGGYIAGCSALIDVLKFHASGFMFSVAMPPPIAAASSRSLELMLEQPERVARLQKNGQFFLRTAKAAGLNTGLSEGFSIVPVVVGDSIRAVKLSNLLMQQGVFTIPVTYPAVPMQEARLRFFITSEHTQEQMQEAIEITALELGRLVEENFGLMSMNGNIGDKLV